MVNILRPYGPGKFNTMLDAYVYSVSLDGGCDDEIGSVSENGAWYGLMRHGSSIFRDNDPFCEPLTEGEAEYLRACAGAILSEDSQGFVHVQYFDSMTDLDSVWSELSQAAMGYQDEWNMEKGIL